MSRAPALRAGLAPAIALLVLSACTLAPRHVRPEAPVAETWPAQTGAGNAGEDARSAADIGWREFFADPRLQSLIDVALRNNRDLRAAALNVEAARAAYRIQRSELLPSIDATGQGVSQRVPASLSTTGTGGVTRRYEVSAGVTAFELDLFGRVRSLRQGALQEYLSLEETRTAVHLSLVAEVADAWFTLQADRELLRLAQQTYESQRSTFDLTRLRFDSGVTTELELHRAEMALRQAEVDIAAYTRRVEEARNALVLLLGDASAPLEDGGWPEALPGESLAAGLPADLLERRPDIRAAEHALRARNADIGAARAAFFPRITLTGSAGRAHTDLDGLFESSQKTWSFVPQVTVPIFAGGALRANLDLATVRKEIGIVRYEQAIQSAFREVADALAARATLDDQLTAQQALARAAAESFRLSDMRYQAGVQSYLDTLIAQRDHYAAQQALIALRLARASNSIALYKALGGGWKD